MEAAGKYSDRVKLVLAVLAFPPPQQLKCLIYLQIVYLLKLEIYHLQAL